MVRQPEREAEGDMASWWSDAATRAAEALDQFRETRLFLQVMLSLILSVAVAIAVWVPVGPLGQLKRAVLWVATHDSDFAGSAARASGWAQARGGWVPATVGVWKDGVSRLRAWVDLPGAETGLRTGVPTGAPVGSATAVGAGPAAVGARSTKAAAESPLMPVDGALLFGFGWPPPGTGNQFHEGLDLVAAEGASVVAVANGTVTAIRLDAKRGRLIEVDHGAVLAVYAQVGSVKVSTGQKVDRGQVIAALARPSGDEQSEPPHLHFEVRTRTGRVAVDPAAYLGLGGTKL